MKKAHATLLGTILTFSACASAQTIPGTSARVASAMERPVSIDPEIVKRPPAKVDPQAIERPPRNDDPKMIERPPSRPAAATSADAEAVRANRKGAPPPSAAGGGPDLPSVIVVPHGHANDEKLGKGCWIRFYNDKGYAGRSLTLVGPVEMPKMNIPGGLWVNWGSAAVGPNATVTTFDYEQFKNRTAVLRPGQRISDLQDRKLGQFEHIHSLRIACAERSR